MGQKANPVSLRGASNYYQGCPHWRHPWFNYITYSAHKLIKACCKKSDIYLNTLDLSVCHDFLLIDAEFIQLHSEPSKKRRSRRHNENTQAYRKKYSKKSWNTVLKRLYFSLALLQKFTGLKRIKLKVRRLKMHTKSIPKRARQKTNFYTRGFNRTKFSYARAGMQLMTLIVAGKSTASLLTDYIRENMRTRSRRRKHLDFLPFLKQAIAALETEKTIGGIKIQIKGRFGHKPKGRSKTWKCQAGPMPFSQLQAPIQARYRQSQTKLGSVGIKVWIYRENNYATPKN